MNSTGQLTLSCIHTTRWLAKHRRDISSERMNENNIGTNSATIRQNESAYLSIFFSFHAQFIICHNLDS